MLNAGISEKNFPKNDIARDSEVFNIIYRDTT